MRFTRGHSVAVLFTVCALALPLSTRATDPACAQPDQAKPEGEKKAPKVDRYGDPLPEGAIARIGTMRLHHGNGIGAAEFSPDGKLIATAGGDDAIRIWDVKTAQLVRELSGHTSGARALAFSGDGRKLASVSGRDQTARCWDVESGKELHRFPAPIHTAKSFPLVAISPDGSILAATGEKAHTVILWDTHNGKSLACLDGKAGEVRALAYSPDGKTISTAGTDGIVRLWDVATGEETHRFNSDGGATYRLVFSRNSNAVITLSADNKLRRFSVGRGEEWCREIGRQGHAESLAAARNADVVVTADNKLSIRLWDANVGRVIQELRGDGQPWMGMAAAVLSPDAKILASWGAGSKTVIRLRELPSGKPFHRFEGHGTILYGVALSPGGKWVATVGADETLHIWDRENGKLLSETATLKYPESRLDFLPDGRHVVLGGNEGLVCVWDVVRKTEVIRFVASPNGAMRCCAVSPDGKAIATGGWDKKVRLHEPLTGKLIGTFPPMPGTVASLAFSPDGRMVAAGCDPDTNPTKEPRDATLVEVWEIATKKSLGRFPHRGSVWAVAFSPDGRSVAAAGVNEPLIYLWEILTGSRRAILRGAEPMITCVSFSPNGRLLASGGWDRRLRLWDPLTCTEIKGPTRQSRVNHILFTDDGKQMITAAEDSFALVWDVHSFLPAARPALEPLPVAQLTQVWDQDLGDKSAEVAYPGMCRLIIRPEQAVTLFAKQLKPVRLTEGQARNIDERIRDLDSSSYAVRERAATELKKFGSLATPALQRATAGDVSEEARKRIGLLLSEIHGQPLSSDDLRTVRAVEVLEAIATTDATRLLAALANGASGALITREAGESLRRLKQRPREP